MQPKKRNRNHAMIGHQNVPCMHVPSQSMHALMRSIQARERPPFRTFQGGECLHKRTG
jgi:hypothetical protein